MNRFQTLLSISTCAATAGEAAAAEARAAAAGAAAAASAKSGVYTTSEQSGGHDNGKGNGSDGMYTMSKQSGDDDNDHGGGSDDLWGPDWPCAPAPPLLEPGQRVVVGRADRVPGVIRYLGPTVRRCRLNL
jgi:hypothetical protein